MEHSNDTIMLDEEDRPEPLEKASLGARLGAFLVDHVIITILAVMPAMLVLGDNPGRIAVMVSLALLAAFLLYGVKDMVKGRSPGKVLFGIGVRMREDTEEVPSAGKRFVRNLFGFLWPIDFCILAFSRNRIKIGDKITGADVYRLPK
ncbi:MAG: RDD family protein [Oscillospiraceae bacterium]|nr:RDD family protein [Oscillospiraceae bacterium]